MRPPTYSEFVLKRLHSLTGVIPLSFFIFFHFSANAFSTVGEEAFDGVVKRLRGLPFLEAIEWGLLFAPFLFHMFYGMYLIFGARPNTMRQGYVRNWAYMMQRVTAMVVFVFILYHVIGIRYIATNHKPNVYDILHQQFSNPFTYWWYMVGIACTCYHLANGLCTFLMTWGITVGRTSQRFAAGAMTGLGLVLLFVGVSAVNGFLKVPKRHDMPANAHEATPSAAAPGVAPEFVKETVVARQ